MPAQQSSFVKHSDPSRNRSKKRPRPELSHCRELVLVDSQKLRQKILKNYQASLKKLEKVTEDLKQFKDSDIERYRLWLECEFSGQIESIRRSEVAVFELGEWIDQIQSYAQICDIPLKKSLEILGKARSEGRMEELWEELSQKEKKAREQAKSDTKVAGNDWIDFEDFFQEVFEEAQAEFESREQESFIGYTQRPKKKIDESAATSMKAIFHQLALRLHPDTNPEQSEADRQRFYAAQLAYREQDIAGLEAIWRQLNGEGEDFFSTQSSALGEILSRKKSLDERRRNLGSELSAARTHPAWNFTKLMANKTSLSKMKRETKDILKAEQRELDEEWMQLNRLLVELEKPAKKRAKSSRRS